ncbi:hypothetical protein ACZ11_07645 [Lysinibacillus xylanilyticus]|uniref:Uncharacterized protein n=2 Tax=Lysinibacillus xylanilyticus TaxID=582475 RepID=A0A0K9FBV1_9BACI|nr:hypothetical protein ACZ11_07645 [Lysinibacillus xylanilyticus]
MNIIRIQEFIEKYLKMKSIKDVSTQITEGGIIYLVYMETDIFEELASKVLNQFEYELSEYTMIMHNHCHFTKYNDNDDIIHEVIAYQVCENVWEFYYGGILDVPKNTGTIEEGGDYYIYKLELDPSDDNPKKTMEKSLDDWLQNNS